MTIESITVKLDVDLLAAEVNEACESEVETGASIKVWVRDNPERVSTLLRDAIAMDLVESYE